MTKITVKITGDNVKGSESGQELNEYEKGETYELDKGLATVLIDADLAEVVDSKPKKAEKQEPKPKKEDKKAEEKSVAKAPENKAVESSPENKAK